jgi:hypothetical protein
MPLLTVKIIFSVIYHGCFIEHRKFRHQYNSSLFNLYSSSSLKPYFSLRLFILSPLCSFSTFCPLCLFFVTGIQRISQRLPDGGGNR